MSFLLSILGNVRDGGQTTHHPCLVIWYQQFEVDKPSGHLPKLWSFYTKFTVLPPQFNNETIEETKTGNLVLKTLKDTHLICRVRKRSLEGQYGQGQCLQYPKTLSKYVKIIRDLEKLDPLNAATSILS